jgi:predicted nucleic acid-binding Zn ribbon protein
MDEGLLKKLKNEYAHRRVRRHQPQGIAGILTELIARRGLARLRGQENLDEAWKQAIGEPGARYTRVGALRRGVLEVLVANSVLLQELAGFQKQTLLKKLRETMQAETVRDLRFRLDGNE